MSFPPQGSALAKTFMDFWSVVGIYLDITSTPADIEFPAPSPYDIVVIAGLPSGITITKVVMMLKVAGFWETSGSDNYIDNSANAGAVRVMKDGGSWGTDDDIGVQLNQENWYIPAGTNRSGGDIIIGAHDLSGVVDGNGTYHFRTEQTHRGDAPFAHGDSLKLVDVQVGLRVYFK